MLSCYHVIMLLCYVMLCKYNTRRRRERRRAHVIGRLPRRREKVETQPDEQAQRRAGPGPRSNQLPALLRRGPLEGITT